MPRQRIIPDIGFPDYGTNTARNNKRKAKRQI
jgi:hypothetical protein